MMSTNVDLSRIYPIVLDFPKMDDDAFFEFCQQNGTNWRIEKNTRKQVILMPPTGSDTGISNANLTADTTIWNRIFQKGYVFDSSAGFKLPNGATRSPDVAWIKKERYDALPSSSRKKFAPICPDFVIELMSENDAIEDLLEKMAEYMDSGCRLGWLIDPENRQTHIFRAEESQAERRPFSEKLSGEDVLQGFEMDLEKIFP